MQTKAVPQSRIHLGEDARETTREEPLQPHNSGQATCEIETEKWAPNPVRAKGKAVSDAVCLASLLLFWGLFLYRSCAWIPLPQLAYAQDLGILLDAGWRFVQGQFPHRDYISPLGPVLSLYAGLPLHWFGTSYASLGHVQGYIGAAFSILAYVALRRSMATLPAVIYSLLVGIVAGGTYHMGGLPNLTTTATVFNRHCWAALMILAPACCLRAKSGGRGELDVTELLSGAVCGLLVAGLLFYKINFFLGAAALILLAFVTRSALLDSFFISGIALAFVITAIPIASLFSFDVVGMARDLSFAFQARRESFVSDAHYFSPYRVLQSNLWELWLCTAIGIGLLVRKKWGGAACLVGVAFLGFGLMNTNSSQSGAGIPLIFSAAVIGVTRLCENSERDRLLLVLAWSMALGIGALSLLWPQAVSWRAWAAASAVVKSSGQPMSAIGSPLEGLYDSSDNMWGNEFWPRVNEGRALIRNSLAEGQTLLYVDFTNIFNYASEAMSPKGVFLWLDQNGTFGMKEGTHPSPEELFADVDFVMFPKRPLQLETVNMWLKLYEAKMNQLFFKIDETQNFYLLARLTPRERRAERVQRSPAKGM